MSGIQSYFKQTVLMTDKWLDRLLPNIETAPTIIHEAMRYSIFAGGKRLRPILAISTGKLYGTPEEELLPAACALEMIHTYSLIHDDLPAMDNDAFRRGKPTNHVVFGEAIAVLAGDALLTQAFRTLAEYRTSSSETKARVILEAAQAAGTVRALIGGQVLDMQFEGKPISAAQLEEIHRAKTGALIRCAVRVGGLLGGAEEQELLSLTDYSERLGLAFQIADDVLDATATSEQLGKTAGKDASVKKATYTTFFGVDEARRRAECLCQQAIESLHKINRPVEILEEIARYVVERDH